MGKTRNLQHLMNGIWAKCFEVKQPEPHAVARPTKEEKNAVYAFLENRLGVEFDFVDRQIITIHPNGPDPDCLQASFGFNYLFPGVTIYTELEINSREPLTVDFGHKKPWWMWSEPSDSGGDYSTLGEVVIAARTESKLCEKAQNSINAAKAAIEHDKAMFLEQVRYFIGDDPRRRRMIAVLMLGNM